MFKNYLKIAIRNVLRHKTHSLINIAGLAIGIACFILMVLFVQDEFSYDQHHEKGDRIYRLLTPGAWSSAPMGSTLLQDYPQVVGFVRFYPFAGLFNVGENWFKESHGYLADASVFNILTLPLVKGNPQTALLEPNSIVISETMAQKYFRDKEPMGQLITVDQKRSFQVSGVLAKGSWNSHLTFDYLISLATANELGINQHRGHFGYFTYLLLAPNGSPVEIESHSSEFIAKLLGQEVTDRIFIKLQPVSRIHLYSRSDYGFSSGGDILIIYIVLLIALLILLVACINYTNLATARTALRVKEIGVRKVVGAQRWKLASQFLVESLLHSLIAVSISVVLVELFLPFMDRLLDRNLAVHYQQSRNWLGMLSLWFLTGIASGTYPAFLLSSQRAIVHLKPALPQVMNRSRLRRILVVFQFSVSVVLLICTMLLYRQIQFMKNKDLGLDKEQVVIIPVQDQALRSHIQALKNEIGKHLDVVSVSASSSVPSFDILGEPYFLEGIDTEDVTVLPTLFVDADFVETFGLKIQQGRSFDKNLPADAASAIVINETVARLLEWESPLRKKIKWVGRSITGVEYSVIGVVKDFHPFSLHSQIPPLVFLIVENSYRFVSVKIKKGGNIPETIKFLENKWREFASAYPFEYGFLDENFNRLYAADVKVSQFAGTFTFLATVIACLGLFGLASLMTEQRTKEVGIRKVLGASMSSIVSLLSNDFLKLVALANIIAWPIAYYVMNRWLQNFAYRIDISWWVFVLAGGLALVIALLTVSTQAIKAALANPVEALRYE
jgi:putative ABC transport system permease protein